MTVKEFNEKYKDYLKDGHYGMAIDNEKIIVLCDHYFQDWIKIPGFKLSQIKTKFGTSRVYCNPIEIPTNELEIEIDKILKTM